MHREVGLLIPEQAQGQHRYRAGHGLLAHGCEHLAPTHADAPGGGELDGEQLV